MNIGNSCRCDLQGLPMAAREAVRTREYGQGECQRREPLPRGSKTVKRRELG